MALDLQKISKVAEAEQGYMGEFPNMESLKSPITPRVKV
jgi:hypothetical protein